MVYEIVLAPRRLHQGKLQSETAAELDALLRQKRHWRVSRTRLAVDLGQGVRRNRATF
jgi:hypothetical protein